MPDGGSSPGAEQPGLPVRAGICLARGMRLEATPCSCPGWRHKRCQSDAALGLALSHPAAETPGMARERNLGAGTGSSTLRVSVLGGFSVRVGSCTVPDAWRLRKSKTLVKLLALADGHRIHRDVLTEVLWPGTEPVIAANSLHQAMHAARRALAAAGSQSADLLRLQDDIVSLSPGGGLLVDAEVFTA